MTSFLTEVTKVIHALRVIVCIYLSLRQLYNCLTLQVAHHSTGTTDLADLTVVHLGFPKCPSWSSSWPKPRVLFLLDILLYHFPLLRSIRISPLVALARRRLKGWVWLLLEEGICGRGIAGLIITGIGDGRGRGVWTGCLIADCGWSAGGGGYW